MLDRPRGFVPLLLSVAFVGSVDYEVSYFHLRSRVWHTPAFILRLVPFAGDAFVLLLPFLVPAGDCLGALVLVFRVLPVAGVDLEPRDFADDDVKGD